MRVEFKFAIENRQNNVSGWELILFKYLKMRYNNRQE